MIIMMIMIIIGIDNAPIGDVCLNGIIQCPNAPVTWLTNSVNIATRYNNNIGRKLLLCKVFIGQSVETSDSTL